MMFDYYIRRLGDYDFVMSYLTREGFEGLSALVAEVRRLRDARMSGELLFVYGTLRRDTRSDMYRLLARYADFIADGTYQGRLYQIDYYPGVTPSDDPSERVKGEVYSLPKPDVVLPKLDEYEECGPGFPEPTEYVRRRQEISLANGTKCEAWVYVYNRPTDDLTRISSGDFLAYKAEQDAAADADKPRR